MTQSRTGLKRAISRLAKLVKEDSTVEEGPEGPRIEIVMKRAPSRDYRDKEEDREEEPRQVKRKKSGFAPEIEESEEFAPPLKTGQSAKQAKEGRGDELEAMKRKMADLQSTMSRIKTPEIEKADVDQINMMQQMSDDLQKKLEFLSAASSQITKKEQMLDLSDKISRIGSAVDKMQKPGGGITIVTEGGEPVNTPVIFEFPRVADDLRSTGIISVGQKSVGDVRGVPAMLALPKAEKAKKISSEWEPTVTSNMNIRYPLIEPYAYVNIRWDDKGEEVVYTVIEPHLT